MQNNSRELYLQSKIQSLIEIIKIMKNRLDKFVDIYGNLEEWEDLDIQQYVDLDIEEETENILDFREISKINTNVKKTEIDNKNNLNESEILAMIKVLYLQILDMINNIKHQNESLNIQYKNLLSIKEMLKKYENVNNNYKNE